MNNANLLDCECLSEPEGEWVMEVKQSQLSDFEDEEDVSVEQIRRGKPKYRLRIPQGKKSIRQIKCRVCGKDVLVTKGTLTWKNRLCIEHEHIYWQEVDRLREERLIKSGYKRDVKTGLWEKNEEE